MTPDPLQERVARVFHDAYERMAPEFGYDTRPESAVPWSEVPENNRALMLATAAVVLADLREAGELRTLEQFSPYDGGPWVCERVTGWISANPRITPSVSAGCPQARGEGE